MLSVLIPVYNQDVFRLVKSIHDQLISIDCHFEIICIDDASNNSFGNLEKISQLVNCNYLLLDKNIGRSAIRNMLATKAKFEYLLFIDSDMLVIDISFILKYINSLRDNDIVYGGIRYEPICDDEKKILRWKYGIEREAIGVKKRNLNPYLSAKFCNLLIRKEVFNSIHFDENITLYGHEDTLFSIQMEQLNFKISHIDNPLLHNGLEDSSTYLDKVEIASKNLREIQKSHPELSQLKEIPLLKAYLILRKFKILFIYKGLYSIFRKGIKRNLLSTDPNIKLLDFYKLYSISSD